MLVKCHKICMVNVLGAWLRILHLAKSGGDSRGLMTIMLQWTENRVSKRVTYYITVVVESDVI